MTKRRPDILAILKENYFTIAIFLCIFFAEFFPWLGAQGGPLFPEITVKYLAVSVIFYTSGLTIKWGDLTKAIRQIKLHILVQTFSFVVIPLFIQLFVLLYSGMFELNTWISKGLVIVGCMPPPVSSAVILTKSIGGNEAAAVFNSALGSVLGIVATPLLLLIYVGISSTLPMLRTVLQLIQTTVIPVLFGQFSQIFFDQGMLSSIPFSKLGQFALLFIIYTSFCDMFTQNDVGFDAKVVLVTLLIVVLIQMVLMFAAFEISFLIGNRRDFFTAEDIIAITFCSTHKSLTLGMPLLKTLYSGYSHLSQISLPLLIYHPVQLILGGFLVPYARKWVKNHSRPLSSYKRP